MGGLRSENGGRPLAGEEVKMEDLGLSDKILEEAVEAAGVKVEAEPMEAKSASVKKKTGRPKKATVALE